MKTIKFIKSKNQYEINHNQKVLEILKPISPKLSKLLKITNKWQCTYILENYVKIKNKYYRQIFITL